MAGIWYPCFKGLCNTEASWSTLFFFNGTLQFVGALGEESIMWTFPHIEYGPQYLSAGIGACTMGAIPGKLPEEFR